MRDNIISITFVVMLVTGFWVGSQPPSDQAVMKLYHEHCDSLLQIVRLYQEDQVGMIVHKNGSIYPDQAADQLSLERLYRYRMLLLESGITRSIGGNPEGAVTFQIFNLIPFIGPMKTLIYSPTPPPLITTGVTNDYTFTPDQYRHVCRPIETDWYLCLDYED